jgi:hypothetical protein
MASVDVTASRAAAIWKQKLAKQWDTHLKAVDLGM